MNENQLNFLDDLAELFRKYNVDNVESGSGNIVFWSNERQLSFAYYQDGRFAGIKSRFEQNYYEPETNQN